MTFALASPAWLSGSGGARRPAEQAGAEAPADRRCVGQRRFLPGADGLAAFSKNAV